MARKKHSAEQIVAILRQIEVELANHKSIGQACKEAGINQQTYYRWRKEYGGLKLEQARRLKELEKENGRLRLCLIKTKRGRVFDAGGPFLGRQRFAWRGLRPL
jgi:putative transposase